MATFHILDYVVFGGGLFFSILLGLFYVYKERHQNTTVRFHRADGKMKALPVALSLVVTYDSVLTYIGFPTEVYLYGFQYWVFNIGMVIGFSSMIWISVPLFYPLKITSVFEYLQLRHNSRVLRQIGVIMKIFPLFVFSSVNLLAASAATSPVLGTSIWVTLIILTTITVLYTSFGGLKTVLFVDSFQFILIITGMMAILGYGTYAVGGIENVLTPNKLTGRLNMFNMDPSPFIRYSFWTLVIGASTGTFGMCFRPHTIQRLNSTPTKHEARKTAVIAVIIFFVVRSLAMLEGLVLFAYTSKVRCDPIGIGQNSNQILPFAVNKLFKDIPGLAGLYLSGLVSSSLSSVSSCLGSVSVLVTEDFLKQYFTKLTDVNLVKSAKVIIILAGVLQIGLVVLLKRASITIARLAFGIVSALGSPVVGLFLLSVFVRKTSRVGLVIGTFVGLAYEICISIGSIQTSKKFPKGFMPPGPIDGCNVGNASILESRNLVSVNNLTHNSLNMSLPVDKKGIDIWFSVSYMYAALQGILVTCITGFIISSIIIKFRKNSHYENAPHHLVLNPFQIFKCFNFKNKPKSPENVSLTIDCQTEENILRRSDHCLN